MTAIKICGITRYEDAAYCAGLGVDFLGFVFVRSSPRFVEPESARKIIERVRGPKFVGVFRDGIRAQIEAAEGLDLIQFHGSESDEQIRAIGRPAIRALKVGATLPETKTAAEWLLFDTGGGTGRTFDWSLLRSYRRTKPFFLAGGLTPDNVELAIAEVRPDAIDLSSGVESAPGIKDHRKLEILFQRVRRK